MLQIVGEMLQIVGETGLEMLQIVGEMLQIIICSISPTIFPNTETSPHKIQCLL